MELIDYHALTAHCSAAPCLDYSNEEIIYAGDQNGIVVAYNLTSKSEEWRIDFDVIEYGHDIEANKLAVDEGFLFVLLANFTVVKINTSNGNARCTGPGRPDVAIRMARATS